MTTFTVREALREALVEEMIQDEKVFILGEEVGEYQGAYKITQGLLEQFGKKRVIDSPISEYGFTGLGVGAAFKGLRPVIEFMSFNFSMQAIDHIVNSAAKTLYMSGGKVSCPIVFRGPNGAAARVGAQHSQCYGSWYAHCPGLKVVAPYDAHSSKHLLKASIQDPNPVVFLENEMLYGYEFDRDVNLDLSQKAYGLGKAAILKEGTDVTLVGFSLMVDFCLKAAKVLEEQGISAEVIDLRSLRPFDKETIFDSLKKTHRLVSVEEGWPFAGISSEILALICEEAFDELDAPPLRVTGEDIPWPYAASLETMALPSVEKIVHKVKEELLA